MESDFAKEVVQMLIKELARIDEVKDEVRREIRSQEVIPSLIKNQIYSLCIKVDDINFRLVNLMNVIENKLGPAKDIEL